MTSQSIQRVKRLLAAVTTATVLAAGGLAVASATASDPAPDLSANAPSATAAPGARAGLPARLGFRQRGAIIRAALRIAADTIGIEPPDLVAEIRSGKTIAEVATAHGVEPSAVIDALVKAASDRIDQAVADGKLDEARAAAIKEHAAQLAERMVNETPPPPPPGVGPGPGPRGGSAGIRQRVGSEAFRVAAETIGIEPEALHEAVQSGQTVAEVATAHGVEPSAVIDALVKAATERITEMATRFVNETPAPRAGGAA